MVIEIHASDKLKDIKKITKSINVDFEYADDLIVASFEKTISYLKENEIDKINYDVVKISDGYLLFYSGIEFDFDPEYRTDYSTAMDEFNRFVTKTIKDNIYPNVDYSCWDKDGQRNLNELIYRNKCELAS